MVYFDGSYPWHGERQARMHTLRRLLTTVLDTMSPQCKVFLGTMSLSLCGVTLWALFT